MLAFLLAIIPWDGVVRESVDLIEVNHFYDENGRLVFDQVIFYDWGQTRYDVRAWRLIKNESQWPQRDQATQRYRCLWQDGEQTREIWSRSIRETWTQVDVELAEREILPKEQRRELRGHRPK